jgi:ParB-like chromosome segregation protein Spo0J
MTDTNRPAVRLRRIPLGSLVPRPHHPNRMQPRVRRAIASQIGATGLYPPLVVRVAGDDRFEILDGHQRAAILAELGHRDARCEVWPVDDRQADVLAATLNQLRGRAEAAAFARQIRRLMRAVGPGRAGELLALSPAAIRQRLSALDRPAFRTDADALDLRAVTFHLNRGQMRLLEQSLRRHAHTSPKRADQLVAAVSGGEGQG